MNLDYKKMTAVLIARFKGSDKLAREIGTDRATVLSWKRGDVKPSDANKELLRRAWEKSATKPIEPIEKPSESFWAWILALAVLAWMVKGVRG